MLRKFLSRLGLGVVLVAATVFLTASAPKFENGILLDKNTVIIEGAITQGSVAKTLQKVLLLDKETVTLFIDSPGGSVIAGADLITSLKDSGKQFRCVLKQAISMAFVIAQTLCNDRVIMNSSILMQHQATYGLEANDAERVESMNNFIKSILKSLDEEQANRLGLTTEQFKLKISNDWWMYGKQAIENKAADRLAPVRCSKDLLSETYKEDVQFFVFSFTVEKSRCPLIGVIRVVEPDEKEKKDDSADNSKKAKKSGNTDSK